MSAAQTNQSTQASMLTLGELLYANPAVTRVSEKEWLALIHAIAAGDEGALRLLYEKTHPLVFTYLLRLTGDRDLTEHLILDVFEMVWCEAPIFAAADGPVLGWIVRQARCHALNHARGGNRSGTESNRIVEDAPNTPLSTTEPGRFAPGTSNDLRLKVALEALTMHEREAIEATFLSGTSYAEMAAQRGEAIGTIKSRIRSGLAKLQNALQARGEKS